ncbi:small acid-soluble spore protein I (minor) [Paenibacillus sp. UNCCL117]|uniref:small acid-soluble spore protein SspI n=1 Tax=unclassified Paenibacillus TaxID=185978 RepID=UPI000888725D|nr:MULTISPECIES: small acid-soluble spore protein SspI [unclassified Paenibacillus]SDE15617.1 small acid-soluble spore protein I (minor) [Paenibacillus sp. cl123]SFW60946.1 small acid-soluble spore protein I (minor) [Paenibacillus sp. UNCCL117]
MNLNLRQAIVQRMHDKNQEELTDIVQDSIDGEERVLPGLGVLFEVIWKHSAPEQQSQMITTLKEHLA